MPKIEKIIQQYFPDRASLCPDDAPEELTQAVSEAITGLNQGSLRISQKEGGEWVTQQWLKMAILLSFRLSPNREIQAQHTSYFDKIESKFSGFQESDFRTGGYRVVPPATVRQGAYIAPDVVLMPSFVNIGAYVDSGTMIDTWATVGSCAQIGRNVHISGGVGIGGVLEPLQANPTIVEDDCFIGARSEIAEGVVIEKGAVVSMGVYLGQSTKILDRESGSISYGRIPSGAVVVPGTLPAKDGTHGLYCAVIVKRVDEKTRSKVSLNELLR